MTFGKFALTLACVLGLGATAAPASADEATLSVAGKGSARFDWLDQGKEEPLTRVATPSSLGSGSWICSPAGGGSKSKCYRR